MTNLSATSLDVVRYYAAAQDAQSKSKFDEARGKRAEGGRSWIRISASATRFSPSRRATSTTSRTRTKYINEALRHLDGMTERERLTHARAVCSG